MSPAPLPGAWDPIAPDALPALLSGLRASWWVSGGWAIDLATPGPHRPHDDLDIGMLRRDEVALHAALPGWELFAAARGELRRLAPGEVVPGSTSSIWCRPDSRAGWSLQVNLDEARGDLWVYRRDARVSRPLAQIARRGACGLPLLALEVQLLYKSKATRPKDEIDFARALPHLDAAARAWLADALRLVAPQHAWRVALDAGRGDQPRGFSGNASHIQPA